MPLDDREQNILDEIERQFYREDPDLVEAVKRIPLAGSRRRLRLSAVGLVVGVILVLVTFSVNVWLALGGFILMVLSATGLIHAYRGRVRDSGEEPRRRFKFRR
ncbi:MAG: DUF3040 domain-containing protein [Acidimicrobiia bacterium]